MQSESSGDRNVVTTNSGTGEKTCLQDDANSGHTTGGGTHAFHRVMEGIDMQIAGLHKIKNALEELNGKGREEIIELIGSIRK
jgi:hypothetical protein